MTSRKLVASVIGVAGCVAVAWALHGLLQIGSCGGDGAPPCPPEATPYFVALLAGLPAVILAGVFGRSPVTFLVFPAVGVGALWAAAEMPAGSGTGAWIFGGSFIAASLVPALLLVAGRRKRARAHRLVTEGATGIGTVTGINDTGVTINRNPRITLRLQIVPEDGSAPFEAEKTITASRVDLPRRGQRFPVWYDRDDRSQLALGTDVDSTASPEVRRLFEKAGIAGQATPEPAATGTDELLDRVTRLYELRQAGALTEAEFQDQKARILGAG